MEIYQRGQAFTEKDGCLEFDFTKLIVKGPNQQYFYAMTRDRIGAFSSVDIGKLELITIPIENIWPPFSDKFTIATELSLSKHYIKEPNLLDYGDSSVVSQISNQVLNEVTVCEVLKANPHPNVATYIGCVVSGDRIRGLAFLRYQMTLAERLRLTKGFDTELCLHEIELGIRHLHSLGLVHNDINPTNIMINDSDRPVIIDFDTCYYHGQQLGPKAGTLGWSLGELEYARFENDYFGLSNLRQYLAEEVQELSSG